LLGDELDGPRGRIYLIKELLETDDHRQAKVAQTHLDRCLTCRACETTCPSGVQYGELLEIGRSVLRSRTRRSLYDAFVRGWLARVLPDPRRFARWAALGRRFKWLLPKHLASQLPRAQRFVRSGAASTTPGTHTRKVLLLNGCVQRLATPGVNAAVARLCDANAIEAITADGEGCCGALNLHLGRDEEALDAMRRNLDALKPMLREVEFVVSTASGCGVTLKDYGRLLAEDTEYGVLAAEVAEKTVDVAELVDDFNVARQRDFQRVAWHAPCTLQHGQQITGRVEKILERAGYELVEVADGHLCCGSAGVYSVLQTDLAEALKSDKLAKLTASDPDVIVTANVGCQNHLQADAEIPVLHWTQLLVPQDD
jgi:glycolate oxidase iron-sulfur subunit